MSALNWHQFCLFKPGSQTLSPANWIEARMTTKLSNTDLVITVVQAAIDVFWRHWDGSAETTRTAREASEFWTMQAFGAHGDWVRTAINGALHVFLRAYLTDG